jgi:cytochrome P450
LSNTVVELSRELTERYSHATFDDPYPIFAERRREKPVMKGDILIELGLPSYTAMYEQAAYTLFRYADIVTAFRDSETFSNSIWGDIQGPLAGRTILMLQGAEHRAWRGMLQGVFTRESLNQWEQTVLYPIAAELIAAMAPAGEADLLELAVAYPMRVIYGIIGLEPGIDDYESFQTAALWLIMAFTADPDPEKVRRNRERALQASRDIFDGLLPVVRRKRSEGATANDMISYLIRAEFEGRSLDDEQIAGFLRSVIVPGTESTTRQFLNTLTTLLQRPEDLDRLRSDRSLILPALIEGDRFEPSPMVLPRVTTRDVEIRGTAIPADSPIVLAIGSGNRDEEAYAPDPDEYRIGREGPHPLTFGFGIHICPGMNTSRREMTALLETMLDELPNLRLDPDAPAPAIKGVHLRAPSQLPVVWDRR